MTTCGRYRPYLTFHLSQGLMMPYVVTRGSRSTVHTMTKARSRHLRTLRIRTLLINIAKASTMDGQQRISSSTQQHSRLSWWHLYWQYLQRRQIQQTQWLIVCLQWTHFMSTTSHTKRCHLQRQNGTSTLQQHNLPLRMAYWARRNKPKISYFLSSTLSLCIAVSYCNALRVRPLMCLS